MIIKRGGKYCLMTKDGKRTLGCHPSRAEAQAQERAINSRKASRHIHALVGGELRTQSFEGRDHLVVPIVALVEGVIFASNAEAPELVLASELERSASGWNGEPVMLNHPDLSGEKISANDPATLERLQFGRVFNARMEGAALKMDAWIDLTKVPKVSGADDVVSRLRAGETVEVSVGAFVDPEEKAGVWKNGKRFTTIWRGIVPDHLALLPDGVKGACSVAMGCGAQRAASAHKGEEMKRNARIKALLAREELPTGDGVLAALCGCTDEQLTALEVAIAEEAELPDLLTLLEMNPEDVCDDTMRQMLHESLRSEAGFMGVDSVFSASKQVIYGVMTGDNVKLVRRSFELDENGKPKLDKKTEEVKPVTRYEPMTATAADCGCGGRQAGSPAEKEEDVKTKKERVVALIESGKTCFVAASAPILEQLTEDQLKALEDQVVAAQKKEADEKKAAEDEKAAKDKAAAEARAAAERKPSSEEDYLAQAPESIKAIVADHKARAAARKTELLKTLEGSKQDAYTKTELESMQLDQLEKIARLAVVARPTIDQSGRGLPRATSEDGPPKPINMAERIKAASEKRTA